MVRVTYLGLVGLLVLMVGVFFAFVANVDQSFPTLMLGWLVAVLSLQMGKVVLRR